MRSIAIVGGGRWARTIAEEACCLEGMPVRVVVHSRRNAAGCAAWIEQKNLTDKIAVSSDWPVFEAHKPDAIVVANEVSHHSSAALFALNAGVPALVEKPVALTVGAMKELCSAAHSNRTVLAVSNVFLFARYMDAFTAAVGKHPRLRRLSFDWHDGRDEVRRGETKSYDPSLAVFDDVLPHIVPIIDRIHPGISILTSLQIRSGGADVRVAMKKGGLDCLLSMSRNALKRRRVLILETDTGTCSLDFSQEPGMIAVPEATEWSGDPLWGQAPGPLNSMLTAFLAVVDGAPLDARLAPSTALKSAEVAADARADYRRRQVEWLAQRIGSPMSPDVVYALKELGLTARWDAIRDPEMLKQLLSTRPGLTS